MNKSLLEFSKRVLNTTHSFVTFEEATKVYLTEMKALDLFNAVSIGFYRPNGSISIVGSYGLDMAEIHIVSNTAYTIDALWKETEPVFIDKFRYGGLFLACVPVMYKGRRVAEINIHKLAENTENFEKDILEFLGKLFGDIIEEVIFYDNFLNDNLSDEETGLFKETCLRPLLITEYMRSRRSGNSFALVLIKVRDLDTIEESVRDLVSSEVGKMIESFSRKSDIITRYEDGFAAMLFDADEIQVTNMFSRFKNNLLTSLIFLNGKQYAVHPYAGATVVTTDKKVSEVWADVLEALEDARSSQQSDIVIK